MRTQCACVRIAHTHAHAGCCMARRLQRRLARARALAAHTNTAALCRTPQIASYGQGLNLDSSNRAARANTDAQVCIYVTEHVCSSSASAVRSLRCTALALQLLRALQNKSCPRTISNSALRTTRAARTGWQPLHNCNYCILLAHVAPPHTNTHIQTPSPTHRLRSSPTSTTALPPPRPAPR